MIVPSTSEEDGGPSRSVVQLSDAICNNSFGINLYSQTIAGSKVITCQNPLVRNIIVKSKYKFSLKLGLPLLKVLNKKNSSNRLQIFHVNGIWHPVCHYASRLAINYSFPLIIQPRGMLEPWALEWKSMKKKLAFLAYQRRNLKQADLFVATSYLEAESIRSLDLKQPISVIPNGIKFDHENQNQCYKNYKKERIALFLSRIHPKKGLINLIKAWSCSKPKDWILNIAGPNECGHLEEVMNLVSHLGLDDSVNYIGNINDAHKWTVYQNSDLFILPSFSENFGIVIAEALSQRLPVITTKGTPWSSLTENNCGWWVDFKHDSLVDAIRMATSLNSEELKKMGENGFQFVKSFDWSIIASKMRATYDWLLSKKNKPSYILTY